MLVPVALCNTALCGRHYRIVEKTALSKFGLPLRTQILGSAICTSMSVWWALNAIRHRTEIKHALKHFCASVVHSAVSSRGAV